MVTDFFANTVDDWTDPGGQLHAYLVPGDEVRRRLVPALETLRGLGFLARQPIEALHVTVQRFPFLLGELEDAPLDHLREVGSHVLAEMAPIRFEFGPPAPVGDSVIVRARLGEDWERVTQSVRAIAQEALGAEALRYEPPFGPHLTLAYATAAGEDSAVATALASDGRALRPVGEATFTEVAWCAVHQNRAVGTYTFETLFATPFGG